MARRKITLRKPKNVSVGRAHARPLRGPRNGDEWYWQAVVYEDGNGRSVWTGWATAEGVVRELASLVARDGLDQPVAAKRTQVETVRDLMETWIAAQQARADLSPHTLVNYEIAARHVASVLGDVKLDRLDLSAVERFRDQRLRAGASSGTVAVQLGELHMAWTWGRQLGICPSRDLPKITVKVKPTRNRRTPTAEDVARVVEVLDGWPRLTILLLFATGARIGEVAALRWRDVDFDNAEVLLSGKTGPRTFPLAPHVLDELRRWGPGDPDAVLMRVLPETVESGIRSRYLPRACKQAGIQVFTAHGLRRSAVDTLLRAGIDVGTAASLLGHSPKVMLHHYRQVTMDDRRKAVAAARLGCLPESKVIAFSRG